MTNLARRERIALAVLDSLTLACSPIPVERDRRTDVDVSEAPFLVLSDLGHQAEYVNLGLISYSMQIEIYGIVAGPSRNLGASINDLYVKIVGCLNRDVSLGGLCEILREVSLDKRVIPDAESSKSFAEFTLSFDVQFETSDTDPTS